MTNTPYSAYTSAIQSSSHFDQLIMLYDGAIKYVNQAKYALQDEDYAKRFNLLNRASSIIRGLQECLDLDNGGETAEALSRAYDDLDIQIIFATSSENIEVFDKIIDNIKSLKSSWESIRSEQESDDYELPQSESNEAFSDIEA